MKKKHPEPSLSPCPKHGRPQPCEGCVDEWREEKRNQEKPDFPEPEIRKPPIFKY
jgi:hypothetical protein